MEKKVADKQLDIDKLEQMRVNRGLTRKEFAKILGVSPITLSAWVTGKFVPSANSVYKIASALNVDRHEICVKTLEEQLEAIEQKKYKAGQKQALIKTALNIYSLICDLQSLQDEYSNYSKRNTEEEKQLAKAQKAVLSIVQNLTDTD